MYNFQMTSSHQNPYFDTGNLRIDANYEIQIEKDVYWVPVNQLGGTKYTNDVISNLLSLTPLEKQNKISTLYEAIQLYQKSKFRGIIDNYKLVNGNLCWNYHKSGYHCVRTNEGCCASNSNWLSYLLHDKYEQLGFLHYSQRNGNGHIMNYIYHNGWYYFIDMMMYRIDSLPFAGIETGTVDGFKDHELIAGNLFKSKDPISFVNLCLKKHMDPPILFTLSPVREVYAMAADGVPNCFDIIHPKGMSLSILYQANDSHVNVKFDEVPACNPQWESIPSEQFN